MEDKEKMLEKGHFWALMFLVLGGVQFFSMFSQVGFFVAVYYYEKCTLNLKTAYV